MPDIFNQDMNFGTAIRAWATKIQFGSATGALSGGQIPKQTGLLVQELDATYQVQVTRLYELGTENKTYYIVGRTMGEMSMSRIAGPKTLMNAFIESFTDPCQVASGNNTITIDAEAGVCENAAPAQSASDTNVLHFHNCLATSFRFRIAAQDMMIVQTLGIMFASLER